MIIKEFRIVLPLSVEESRMALLYSIAEASKNETGGGEGLEWIVNEPYSGREADHTDITATKVVFSEGQYTKKCYHLQHKVPSFIRVLAPSESIELMENAWHSFPYCRTEMSNAYMKECFTLTIDTLVVKNEGKNENIFGLSVEELQKRDVVNIDIVNDPISPRDYKESEDPTKVKSEKTGRGPLTADWQQNAEPRICVYKLVRLEFKWFNLQSRVESVIIRGMHRFFTTFFRQQNTNALEKLDRLQKNAGNKKTYSKTCLVTFLDQDKTPQPKPRNLVTYPTPLQKLDKGDTQPDYWTHGIHLFKVFCWMDRWYDLTLDEIRDMEEKCKQELDVMRAEGNIRGMTEK